jgi:WD40 repeat protein
MWKHPTLDMVASLSGHTHRVLHLAMSPDGETIVTSAGDETLRFWSAFPKKEQGDVRKESALDYGKVKTIPSLPRLLIAAAETPTALSGRGQRKSRLLVPFYDI